MKKDIYLLLRIDDLLDKFEYARFLLAINLASGYYQVRLAKDTAEKTAFITRYSLYEYTVLPLGLYNALLNFQRLMNNVMGQYIDDFVLVYLDDTLVFGTTEYEHEHHLRFVFQKVREHKPQAKLKKFKFGKPWVKYLGHIVGSEEVHVNQDKVTEVANCEAPTDIKEVQ